MSNELVSIFGTPEDAVGKFSDEKALASISKVGDYLRRFQLYDSNSKKVKRKLIGMGRYGIDVDKDNVIDLGEEVIAVVGAVRPCAARLNGGKVLSYYNIANPEFQKIKAESDEKGFGSGCVYGPQYLLWLPVQKELVLFHLNNKTGRRAAPPLTGLVTKSAILRAKYIDNGEHQWYGPEFFENNTPIMNLPDPAYYTEQREKFKNPPDNGVETEDPDTTERAR